MGKDRAIEFKSFEIDIKSVDEQAGTFEGYGAVFGNVDLGFDKIAKGAFTKTLREKKRFPLLWQHNPSEPIGVFSAKQDENGLLVKAELNMDVEKAKETLSLLKQKAINGLSIGYTTIKSEYETIRGKTIRVLKELKLHETSVVTFPMNELATVTDVKRLDNIFKYVAENKNKEGFKEKILSLLKNETVETTQNNEKKSMNFEYILSEIRKK
jgi:HK97 family phage prohead protease